MLNDTSDVFAKKQRAANRESKILYCSFSSLLYSSTLYSHSALNAL